MELPLEGLKYFLALARYRTLISAAERLEVEHTTVRRRIASLEETLGKRLFDKTPTGWGLTKEGSQLLPFAERIEQEAEGARAIFTGEGSAPRGTVRILATDGFGSAVLAPGLAQLRSRYPEIDIELVTTNSLITHGISGFDIGVSITEPHLRKYTSIPLAPYELRLYASREYLDEHGPLKSLADIKDHDLIWFVDSLLELPEISPGSEETIREARSPFRTTNLWAQVEATIAGAGLGLLPCFIAERDDRFVPVLHGEFQVKRKYWMVVARKLLNRELVSFVANHIHALANRPESRLMPPR